MPDKVRTTYLEITKDDPVSYSKDFMKRMNVLEIENDIYINFVFFAGVGLPWKWYSRLKWSISEWNDYFRKNNVKTFIGFSEKRLVGYYELMLNRKNDAEIKLFGLFPSMTGKGLGGVLLSHAIKSSFDHGAARIWLHTCSNDSEAALGNYLARGFRIFKEEEKPEDIPERNEVLKMISDFFNGYIIRNT